MQAVAYSRPGSINIPGRVIWGGRSTVCHPAHVLLQAFSGSKVGRLSVHSTCACPFYTGPVNVV